LSRFTEWRPYEHRAVAEVDGRFVPMPINRATVNALHGLSLTESEVADHLKALAEPRDAIHTSEDAVVSKVGRDLYERLFRGYTRKQWDLDPAQLHASVCARIPVRTNDDDRYFVDTYQAMPRDGYTAMFTAMLDHPGIDVQLGVDHGDVPERLHPERLVWTGSIDAFFSHRLGRLPYRSLRFELETRRTPGGRLVQPTGTVNYPHERIPYTRVTEFRHLTGQSAETSTLAYEYPSAEGDPYYPIPRPENRELYHRYEALANSRPDVLFVGRLARYQYLNMDQVVAAALVAVERWPAVSRALATAA
jgi:UDP-galactopyranose mutase